MKISEISKKFLETEQYYPYRNSLRIYPISLSLEKNKKNVVFPYRYTKIQLNAENELLYPYGPIQGDVHGVIYAYGRIFNYGFLYDPRKNYEGNNPIRNQPLVEKVKTYEGLNPMVWRTQQLLNEDVDIYVIEDGHNYYYTTPRMIQATGKLIKLNAENENDIPREVYPLYEKSFRVYKYIYNRNTKNFQRSDSLIVGGYARVKDTLYPDTFSLKEMMEREVYTMDHKYKESNKWLKAKRNKNIIFSSKNLI